MSSIDINPVFWTIGFTVSILLFTLGMGACAILIWKGLMISLDQIGAAMKEKLANTAVAPAGWKAVE